MVICLEQDADLHMAQLMPIPLTVSCFSKIQIGFTSLVPAHPGSPEKGCVCVYCVLIIIAVLQLKMPLRLHVYMCTCTATNFDFILCTATYRYLLQSEFYQSKRQ